MATAPAGTVPAGTRDTALSEPLYREGETEPQPGDVVEVALQVDYRVGIPVQPSAATKRETALTKVTTLVRIEAWLAVLIVIVLSVIPGNMRPHVLANGYYEHFTAYFITGSLMGIGYSRPKQLLSSAIMLALCGGTLEIVQLWIPDRTADVGDFAASAFGAWAALVLTCVIRWAGTDNGKAVIPLPK
jgi:hypothetical protein